MRWSQEHLAALSGLSLRTIQRVEAGNSASNETLKSLASVFEIDISKLTETITVIDKTTENWQRAPIWVTIGMWGIRKRSTAILIEKLCVLIGVLGFLAHVTIPKFTPLVVFWFSAYWLAVSIRWIDKEGFW